MSYLLIALAAVAADPLADRTLAEINLCRARHDLPPVAESAILAETAELCAEWAAFRTKSGVDFSDHNVSSAWLLDRHPELLWERLLATYMGTLPDNLSSHDVARLCGWAGGLVVDIGYEGRAKADRTIALWERSPGHSAVLLGEYDVCGVGYDNVPGGVWLFAVFGRAD